MPLCTLEINIFVLELMLKCRADSVNVFTLARHLCCHLLTRYYTKLLLNFLFVCG